jgi:hypothetical protein
MSNILDQLDVIKNIEGMYESNSSFEVLKDFERVLDELDLYVYKNWEDGELAAGPSINRHWISAKFFWPRDKMPDPMGGKRLLDYDCKVLYEKSYMVKPRQVMDPGDLRPNTKKGKMDKQPIWIVEIRMPKKLLADMYSANLDNLENIEDSDVEEMPQDAAPSPEQQDQAAPDADLEGGDI